MCYINYRRTWNITSLPKCWLSSWEIWCSFLPRNHCIIRVFSQLTASVFYPWGNVVSPRERVPEGLCGWRHGNSFPMTQSAQSLRQMRSIPHCSKAVFYVFVFGSIYDSAILHNLSPEIFHWAILRFCIWWQRLIFGITKMEAALFLVGKGEPPSLS